jgi:flagellar biosynthesis chaperone FliJ
MAHTNWKLSQRYLNVIDRAETQTRSMVEHLRAEFEDMGKDWQESDEGLAVESWIETLEAVVEALAEVQTEPDPV